MESSNTLYSIKPYNYNNLFSISSNIKTKNIFRNTFINENAKKYSPLFYTSQTPIRPIKDYNNTNYNFYKTEMVPFPKFPSIRKVHKFNKKKLLLKKTNQNAFSIKYLELMKEINNETKLKKYYFLNNNRSKKLKDNKTKLFKIFLENNIDDLKTNINDLNIIKNSLKQNDGINYLSKIYNKKENKFVSHNIFLKEILNSIKRKIEFYSREKKEFDVILVKNLLFKELNNLYNDFHQIKKEIKILIKENIIQKKIYNEPSKVFTLSSSSSSSIEKESIYSKVKNFKNKYEPPPSPHLTMRNNTLSLTQAFISSKNENNFSIRKYNKKKASTVVKEISNKIENQYRNNIKRNNISRDLLYPQKFITYNSLNISTKKLQDKGIATEKIEKDKKFNYFMNMRENKINYISQNNKKTIFLPGNKINENKFNNISIKNKKENDESKNLNKNENNGNENKKEVVIENKNNKQAIEEEIKNRNENYNDNENKNDFVKEKNEDEQKDEEIKDENNFEKNYSIKKLLEEIQSKQTLKKKKNKNSGFKPSNIINKNENKKDLINEKEEQIDKDKEEDKNLDNIILIEAPNSTSIKYLQTNLNLISKEEHKKKILEEEEIIRKEILQPKIISEKKKNSKIKNTIVNKTELEEIKKKISIIKNIQEMNFDEEEKEILLDNIFKYKILLSISKKSKEDIEIEEGIKRKLRKIVEKYIYELQISELVNTKSVFSKKKNKIIKSKINFLKNLNILEEEKFNEIENQIINQIVEDENRKKTEIMKIEEENKKKTLKNKIQPKTKKVVKLIYDNSYMFKPKQAKKKKIIKEEVKKIINTNYALNYDNYNINNSQNPNESFNSNDSKKASKYKVSNSKFSRRSSIFSCGGDNFKSRFNEKANEEELLKYEEELKRKKKEIEDKRKREKLYEERLYSFFEKIKRLKNNKDNPDELEKLIDERFNTNDNSKENRINDFIHNLQLERQKEKYNIKFKNKRLGYSSPLIFTMDNFYSKNKNKIVNKDIEKYNRTMYK